MTIGPVSKVAVMLNTTNRSQTASHFFLTRQSTSHDDEDYRLINDDEPNVDPCASPSMYKYYSNILTNLSDSRMNLNQLSEHNANTNSTSSFSSSSNNTNNTNNMVTNGNVSVNNANNCAGDTNSVSEDSVFMKKTNTSSSIATNNNAANKTSSSPLSHKITEDQGSGTRSIVTKNTSVSSLASAALPNSSSLNSRSDNLPRKTYKSSHMEWCGSQMSLGKIRN